MRDPNVLLRRSLHPAALVPVAAILVASLRLHAPDLRFHLRYDGPNEIPCDVLVTKAPNWVGSNTARRSWCSRRRALR